MKKIYWIHNLVFLPLLDGNKYIKASISGVLIDAGNQYTLDEIKQNHPNISEASDLHDLCKQWGTNIYG